MASKVVMAQLSPTMEEGRLVEWKVSEGDEVKQGDVVAEIETDKANMDVEAMGAGVLRTIVVQEGETVPVGALIGVIGEPDEDISDLLEEAGAAAGAEPAGEAEAAGGTEAPQEEEEEEEAAPESGEPAGEDADGQAAAEAGAEAAPSGGGSGATAGGAQPSGDGRVRVSPVARRMADEAGLDVRRISGSGPSGRVIKRDVEAALEEREAAPAGAARRADGDRLAGETVEASQMRKAIARRLTQSLGPVPHFFLTTEVDMGRLLDLRAELNEGRADGADAGADGGDGPPKIGVNDLLLKATAEALVRHPEVNASWDDGSIRRHGSVDLGIAVAVEDGLITPVLRDAEAKGLEAVAAEARELIGRARDRDLSPEEYQGATFSVSNLGMFEIDEFTAVINPPESGILAIGRTREKPVAVDGEVVVRRRMRATMSCDHRVVDGAMGARFLETWKGMLENPLEMLL
jgi:pyruvate dehydrogenase E2 component (dihydrolipoamide acetyltransferase)